MGKKFLFIILLINLEIMGNAKIFKQVDLNTFVEKVKPNIPNIYKLIIQNLKSNIIKIKHEIEVENLEDQIIQEKLKEPEFKDQYQEEIKYILWLSAEVCNPRSPIRYGYLLFLNTINMNGKFGRILEKFISNLNGYFFLSNGQVNKNLSNHDNDIKIIHTNFIKSIFLANLQNKNLEVAKRIINNYKNFFTRIIHLIFYQEWQVVDKEVILTEKSNKDLLNIIELIRDTSLLKQNKIKVIKEIIGKYKEKLDDHQAYCLYEMNLALTNFEFEN